MRKIIGIIFLSTWLLSACGLDRKNNNTLSPANSNNSSMSGGVNSGTTGGTNSGTTGGTNSGTNVSAYQIVNPIVSTSNYAQNDLVLAPVSSERTLLTYKMSGVNGAETTATTLVFVPNRVAPREGWSIVVWAHGTTGVADKCAPSQQGLKGTEIFIAMLLSAGYVVVAPDYEGLGSQGNHPYLNLKSEAYSITDAVAATRTYLTQRGQSLSRKWLTVGHSQGGHAALGAAQYAARINLDYKGTIAIAPASNLERILVDGTQRVQGQMPAMQIPVYGSLDTFTSFVVAGTQGNYNMVAYNEVFKSNLADVAPVAEQECAPEVLAAISSKMSQYAILNRNSLAGYGRLQDNFFQNLKIKQFLDKDSQPLTVKVNTPIILYQGEIDTIVPVVASDLLNSNASRLGTIIDYKKLPLLDHFTIYTNNLPSFVIDVKRLMPIQ